jgi:hypothetical protein
MLNPSVAKLFNDLEQALEAVLESDAISAAEAEINAVLPANSQPYVAALETATLSIAQQGLAALLAKIPPATVAS